MCVLKISLSRSLSVSRCLTPNSTNKKQRTEDPTHFALNQSVSLYPFSLSSLSLSLLSSSSSSFALSSLSLLSCRLIRFFYSGNDPLGLGGGGTFLRLVSYEFVHFGDWSHKVHILGVRGRPHMLMQIQRLIVQVQIGGIGGVRTKRVIARDPSPAIIRRRGS